MPCWEVFEEQDEAYKRTVLSHNGAPALAVEAASGLGWDKYSHDQIVMNSFGNFH